MSAMIFPSYPGNALKKGAQGKNVRLIQEALNLIFDKYPLADKIYDEHYFGNKTEKAVREVQQATNLRVDGVVGTKTWHAILAIANLISTT